MVDLERFLDRVEAEERRKERRQRQQDLYEAAPKLTQREEKREYEAAKAEVDDLARRIREAENG